MFWAGLNNTNNNKKTPDIKSAYQSRKPAECLTDNVVGDKVITLYDTTNNDKNAKKRKYLSLASWPNSWS